MNRFFTSVLLILSIFALCSCSKTPVPLKKELPKLPSSFREQTVISHNNKTFSAVTDYKADGTVEFYITDHDSLKGLVFQSKPTGFCIISDNMNLIIDPSDLPQKNVFLQIANALRTASKSISQPTVGQKLLRYDYPESGFHMFVDSYSGNIVSLIFDNSLSVKF
ncbi:MAG: hypothetical protein IJB86_02825 [Clostridia bacterium]|nr:hypothetical protein [Clostridia bacterium]